MMPKRTLFMISNPWSSKWVECTTRRALLDLMAPIVFAAVFACPCVSRATAWGPHAEITQAALDALGSNDLLVRHLGEHAQRLTNYAWMADYRRLPFEEPGE